MADLQQGTPITPQSIFHVASVSKQFAAIAVAGLAQDGKLSLDDDVRKHIPELPAEHPRYTVRQLMYHTAGVRDHWELLGYAGWRYPSDLFTNDDVMDILVRQKALNFNPGDEWIYSNGGYTLLAVIAERIAGKSLRALSDERIFKPLGMTRTHVHDDHTFVVPGRTAAYQEVNGVWKSSIPQFDTHGATSLFTTVEDLLKWQHNFETGQVYGKALLREAETSGVLNDGRSINYGYGVSVGTYRGTPALGHGGADAGYRADVVRFPAHGLDVAVACNFAAATPNVLSRGVADIVIGDKLAPAPVVEPKEVTGARAEAIAGTYRSSRSDLATVFRVREGKLVLGPMGPGFPVNAIDDSRIRMGGNEGVFVGPAGGAPVALRVLDGGKLADSLVRMAPFEPNRAALAQYVGDYWSDELRVSYRIEQGDSGLVVKTYKHGSFPMRPLYQDAFQAQRPGTIRFVRTGGKVTGFRVSGGRVRNVVFTRGTRP
ncbi:MAG: beta-lactamase family protein [Gemmatimonadales bacterium]|nr:beta-lactamase family protein [Gemmatimonadales bacterium]